MITINEQKRIELHNERAQRNRALAYKEESDPIFFKWKRGEATEQEYLAKIEEIRTRFPYV